MSDDVANADPSLQRFLSRFAQPCTDCGDNALSLSSVDRKPRCKECHKEFRSKPFFGALTPPVIP